jgi:hypothetical protein
MASCGSVWIVCGAFSGRGVADPNRTAPGWCCGEAVWIGCGKGVDSGRPGITGGTGGERGAFPTAFPHDPGEAMGVAAAGKRGSAEDAVHESTPSITSTD